MSITTTGSEYIDAPTPRHSLLSGRFKQSFAYLSLRTRFPGIMSEIMTFFSDEEDKLIEIYGPKAQHDIQRIIEQIERLNRELERDRLFQFFTGNEPDKHEWNSFLAELPYPKRTFYHACWLHAECYIYRKLVSFVENSCLRGYDFFAHLKQEDLVLSVYAMRALTIATRDLKKDFSTFNKLLRISLWSNRYAMNSRRILKTNIDGILLAASQHHLLVNDAAKIWNCLFKAGTQNNTVTIDFICDNAGFEFFVDMLLLEYLIDNKFVSKVRVHVKTIPWYISDVTESDIMWILKFLSDSDMAELRDIGKKFELLFRRKKIEIYGKSHFWTGPQAYFVMCDVAPELFKVLTTGQLSIFKGDLNYRKLMGDYIWDSTEEFITCLRGFRPTNMCAIRTVKSEVVCGLPEGKADTLLRTDPQWMIKGTYGLIQYTDSLKCCCLWNEPRDSAKSTQSEALTTNSNKE